MVNGSQRRNADFSVDRSPRRGAAIAAGSMRCDDPSWRE
jgi:hypothetical protein